MKAATQSVSKKDNGAQHGQVRLQRTAVTANGQGGASDARQAQAEHAAGQLLAAERICTPPIILGKATGYVVATRSMALPGKGACGSGKASTGETCSPCQSPTLQAKISIGASNDPFEQEADQVADQVLAAPPHCAVSKAAPRIQRFTGQPSGPAETAPASVDRVLASPGSSLDSALLQDMKQRFGYDFSQVRVHSGAAAEQSARDADALAYTVGNNIVFNAGQFAPATPEGRRLIAHELTHVVQQSLASPSVLRRRSTFGAGGCARQSEEDEDNSGPKGAGRLAHTQIQSYLLPNVLNEQLIPRANKNLKGDFGCQSESVEDGRADLLKRGGLIYDIGEIKPIGSAARYGVEDAQHYVRRSSQSIGRQYGTGPCGAAGKDDEKFVKRLIAGPLPPTFGLLTGIFAGPTLIGDFDGDRSRTLKAELVAPGAVGYWCTGGKSDTYTCGASEQETNAFIDRMLLGPAQEVLQRFLRDNIERRIETALSTRSIGDLIRLGERLFGPQIRNTLRPYLGPVTDKVLGKASAEQIAQLVEKAVGPEAQAVVTTLVRRITDLIINEMRVQLRNVLAEIVRDALTALCVGVSAVALSELLDKIGELMRKRARQLVPVVAIAVAARLASLLAKQIATILLEMVVAIGKALWFVVKFLARVFAAILVLLLCVAVVFVAILALIAVFTPIPGDELALAAAAAFLATLVPVVGRFVWSGDA